MGTGYLMEKTIREKPKMGLSIVKETREFKKPQVDRYSNLAKEESINKDLQSMGYNNIQDFYAKHPRSNFDVTPLSTKMIRGAGKMVMNAGRAVKNIYKRYVKKTK